MSVGLLRAEKRGRERGSVAKGRCCTVRVRFMAGIWQAISASSVAPLLNLTYPVLGSRRK